MEEEILKIKGEEKGKRLDIFLAERLRERFSRSQIKRLIESGKVLVNESPRKVHYKLSGSEDIEIIISHVARPGIEPEDIPLDVIYEDDHIIVINKPKGLVVHPATGNPDHTLVNALLFHTRGKLSHIDSSPRPGIVHRLDKEVSGLMVAAKTDSAHLSLVKGFKERTIKRRYIAFVKGVVSQDEGITSLPIGRAERDRKKMAVRFSNSKEALTIFKVLKRFEGHTKLQLELETGRTHQIRVHMSYMGYPIIGDTKYGGGGFKRIALYAAELIFSHPIKNTPLHYKIDIPEELESLET
ncbi:MAG: RluA family pseudouridine synthase [Candidatus Omnitrophota bacterium]